jgi:tetratricopeptide (TPR) repeat protein
MRSLRMRSLRLSSLALVLVALLSVPARAGDLELPSWAGDDVILKESSLPAGWKAVGGEEHLAAAKEKGWHHQELGTPLRMLIVTGPESARGDVIRKQSVHGTEQLLRIAEKRMAGSLQAGRAVLQSALALEPKSGAAHAFLGYLIASEADQVNDRGQVEKAKEIYATALDPFRKAFGPDVAPPMPPPPFAYRALSQFGAALLWQKTPEANAEAKKVLAKAVELEQHAQNGQTWAVRYNLACALSLLGEKAEAVKHIAVSLDAMKSSLPKDELKRRLDHLAKDPDLDNIRNEPAFKEAVERVSAGTSSDGGI